MLRSSFAIQCRFIFILLTVLTSCGYCDYKTDKFSENAGELKTATFSVINRNNDEVLAIEHWIKNGALND